MFLKEFFEKIILKKGPQTTTKAWILLSMQSKWSIAAWGLKQHLRNEFNFWDVQGIMNTSGLLQETPSIHDSMNIQKN